MTRKRSPELPAGFRNNDLVFLHYDLQERVPQVYHFLATAREDFDGLSFKPKDGGILLIAKRVNGDGQPEVLFCGGYDCISALMDFERALAANRWKPDKPWSPNGQTGGVRNGKE